MTDRTAGGMRPYAWASIMLGLLASLVIMGDYYEGRANTKAPVYPYASTGAYAGDPLTAYANTTGANRYSTFESPGGSDYVVPANTTLVITRLVYQSASLGDVIAIGYGDDGVGDSASAPTNA